MLFWDKPISAIRRLVGGSTPVLFYCNLVQDFAHRRYEGKFMICFGEMWRALTKTRAMVNIPWEFAGMTLKGFSHSHMRLRAGTLRVAFPNTLGGSCHGYKMFFLVSWLFVSLRSDVCLELRLGCPCETSGVAQDVWRKPTNQATELPTNPTQYKATIGVFAVDLS